MNKIRFLDNAFRELEIHSGIPEKWSAYEIPNAEGYHVKVNDSGYMLFQHVYAARCDIWVSNYIFTKPTRVYCRTRNKDVEFHHILEGDVLYQLNDIPWQHLKAGEHNVLFTPEIRSSAVFNKTVVTTMDFHLKQSEFKRLVGCQPVFKKWLHYMRLGIDAQLFSKAAKTSLQVRGLVTQMIAMCQQSHDLNDQTQYLLEHYFAGGGKVVPDNCPYHYTYEEVKILLSLRERITDDFRQKDMAALRDETLMGYKKFTEGFKLLYGLAPTQYMMQEKINQAKSLLISSNLKNDDIALVLDFNSPSHFATTFKRMVNCTPTTYRKKYQNRGLE